MKSINILSIEINDVSRDEALQKVKWLLARPGKSAIVTPNPEIVLKAKNDKNLRRIINQAAISLPDGFGLKVAARILGERLVHRVAGSDLMLDISGLAAAQGWPIFLLGGKAGVAKRAAAALRNKYPGLIIAGAASGGRVAKKGGQWAAEDPSIISKIEQSKARIIFVAFGCPKQEKWIADNLPKFSSLRLAMAVGGSFDFLAGAARRAPRWLSGLGLEWLWRLVTEPSRALRIWNAVFKFLWVTIAWRVSMLTRYRENAVGFILNKNDEVLVVKRARDKEEHWQLPQGGVENGEAPMTAVLREMAEEVGLKNLTILGAGPRHRYVWPTKWHRLNGGYKGQKQTIFYLRFDGKKDEIVLDYDELSKHKWVPLDMVVSTVHSRRKKMASLAVCYYQANYAK